MFEDDIRFTIYSEPEDPYDRDYQWGLDGVLISLHANGASAWRSNTRMPSPAAGGGWVTEFMVATGAGLSLVAVQEMIDALKRWFSKERSPQKRIRFRIRDIEVDATNADDLGKVLETINKSLRNDGS